MTNTQTRITSIAAARDDVAPSNYDASPPKAYFDLAYHPVNYTSIPCGLDSAASFEDTFNYLLKTLMHAGINDIFSFRLSSNKRPFVVVKTVAPSLEDKEANVNWRPGIRALQSLSCE